jgi:peroxiredoxin
MRWIAVKEVPNIKSVPELSLRTSENEWWNIRARSRKKNIVIYFVHDLHCDACRARLRAFAQDYRDWEHIKGEIVAVLPNSPEELKNLAEELKLPFPLLSDVDAEGEADFIFEQLDSMRPPKIFVVDRLGTLYYHEISDSREPFEEEKTILNAVEGLENRATEMGALG